MSTVLLAGDSHLARIRGERITYLENRTGRKVINQAKGGADSRGLLQQLETPGSSEIIVISVGVNDAAPWKQVPLEEFESLLKTVLSKVKNKRIIYFSPLEVMEVRLNGENDRSNSVIRQYSTVGSKVFAEYGGNTFDTTGILSAASEDIYELDGVHMNNYAYEFIIRELARTINNHIV